MRDFIIKCGLALAVMLGSAAAMWPSAGNGFAWDDLAYVTANDHIRDLSPAGIRNMFARTHFGLYKPVTMLSFAVNYRFSGLNPRPYHITNIMLHAANAALVFTLILLLTQNSMTAFACAALFGVHPMHVESVAWIAERKDMLYAFFFLLASILYIRYAKTRGRTAYAGSLACFGISLAAKPMGITLPAALFVYDYLLDRGFDKKLAAEKAPYALIAALFGAATLLLLDSSGQLGSTFSLADRTLFTFYGLKFYIGKLLVPLNLSAMYPFPMKSGGALPLDYWLSPVTVIGCLILLAKYFRGNHIVMAGAAFYIITISPVLQLFQVGPVVTADRYTYIPALGLFLPVSAYAASMLAELRAKNRRKAAVVFLACAGLAFSALMHASRARCSVWTDDLTLFSDAAVKHPAFSTLKRYGVTLGALGRTEEMLRVYEVAINLAGPEGAKIDQTSSRDLLEIYTGIAINLARCDREASETLLREIFPIMPSHPLVLMAVANLQYQKKRPDIALRLLDSALKDPLSRPDVYTMIGDIHLAGNDCARAGQAYSKALELAPAHTNAAARMRAMRRLCTAKSERPS
ncbi:MAG: hypothetical protein PHW69_04520 [Elusimicrobiaceae bacterium]|nr:hypothetical protein [Elusimicrobiaceae bacterium]